MRGIDHRLCYEGVGFGLGFGYATQKSRNGFAHAKSKKGTAIGK